MSIPINNCLIIKAAKSEEGYQAFLKIMKINLLYGHWSHFGGGECDETATDEEIETMNKRLKEDTKDIKPRGAYERDISNKS